MNKAATQIPLHVILWTYRLISLEYIPRSRTAGPKCLHQFLLMWVKHGSYSCSTSLPLLYKVGLKILSQSNGLFSGISFWFKFAFPKWCAEPFHMLIPNWISSFKKCLFFCPLKTNELFTFFLLTYRNSLYILEVSPLSGLCTIIIYSYSGAFAFSFS